MKMTSFEAQDDSVWSEVQKGLEPGWSAVTKVSATSDPIKGIRRRFLQKHFKFKLKKIGLKIVMKCEVWFFQKSRLKTYLENGRILLRRVNCCLHPTRGFKVMLQSLFQPDDGNGDDDEDDDGGDDGNGGVDNDDEDNIL